MAVINIKIPSLGQPVLASIQNSEWPHFRASFVQLLVSNLCQTKWPVYRGGRTSESRNSDSLCTVYTIYKLSAYKSSMHVAMHIHAPDCRPVTE